MTGASSSELFDDIIGAALRGPHRKYAVGSANVVSYHPDISPLASIRPETGPSAWRQLDLLPVNVIALATTGPLTPPGGWQAVDEFPVTLMTGQAVLPGIDDSDLEPLTDADVPRMLDLVARTQPGPFQRRTVELGGYVGIRRDGILVAMAGRRVHAPGWVEISAVCTDPAFQGQGYGRRVTLGVAAGIRAQGLQPFLHVVDQNPAAALYRSLGFADVRKLTVTVLKRA